MNATITVTFGDQARTFECEGTELSATRQHDGSTHRYLSNGSKWEIDMFVERALLEITQEA